jgi:hypothetical protein
MAPPPELEAIRRGFRALLPQVALVAVVLTGCSRAERAEPVPDTSAITTTSTTAAPEPQPEPEVLLAVGDIASCRSDGDEATAALLDGHHGTIATLGDNVYERGTPTEFAECFEPSWGRHKARIKPAAGNHDYGTRGGAGYFEYFGEVAGNPGEGWYSYDLGPWHVIALNSVCAPAGGCHAGSPQEQWLRADLAAHTDAACTLAYWHHTRFSSGLHGSDPSMAPFVEALYEAGADMVLAGHDHHYERFAPLAPDGTVDDAAGIRFFVVGTGGNRTYPVGAPLPGSEVHFTNGYGILRLELGDGAYTWEYLGIPGVNFTDSGAGTCH